MAQFNQIERISWLLNFLKYKAYPSKKEIIDHLAEKEIYLTERSFERDLKTIRELFFIDVVYNRFKNGYYIYMSGHTSHTKAGKGSFHK
jgi:arginine repressor